MYSALLMSSGLTFGAIASLYGLSHGIIDKGQYSVLVGAVIASGIVPTMIAGNHFVPHHLVSDAKPAESQKGE
jgi:inner membrane protein involved in colicin E2 resistance